MCGKISPSMMCAGITDVEKYLRAFEEAQVEYLHIDVMDGSFVPNFTLGTDYIKNLRRMTSIPLDIHLMIQEPEEKLEWFDIHPGEFVSVHYESTAHIQKTVSRIREKGGRAMLAVNPGTPITVLDYLLDDLDGVLIMTVNPGFSGQKLIAQTLRKITDVKHYLHQTGRDDVEIEVDGNVSYENAARMRQAGADIFVAGTSSLFHDQTDIYGSIARFRSAIQ